MLSDEELTHSWIALNTRTVFLEAEEVRSGTKKMDGLERRQENAEANWALG